MELVIAVNSFNPSLAKQILPEIASPSTVIVTLGIQSLHQYFQLLGMTLLRGRVFTESGTLGAGRAADLLGATGYFLSDQHYQGANSQRMSGRMNMTTTWAPA